MNRNLEISTSSGRDSRMAFARRAGRARGCLLAPPAASAQSAEDLRLTVGKSVVIDYPSDIRQISTSNPDIVDASPVTTREILLHGKGLGTATMVVWSKAGERTFYNVTVDLNLDPLRQILQGTFPNEKIVPAELARFADAERHGFEQGRRATARWRWPATFAKTVVNNLQLARRPIEKQILLRVKFAELDRTKAEQYGVNWFSPGGPTPIGRFAPQQSGIYARPRQRRGRRAQHTVTIATR